MSDEKVEHQLKIVSEEMHTKKKAIKKEERNERIKDLVKKEMDTVLENNHATELNRIASGNTAKPG